MTGLYNGDTSSVVSGMTLSTATGAAATAGTHAITITGGTAANYTITGVNGTLTVSPAPLTVTADDKSKVYGAADPPLTYTASGTLYYGDTDSVISGRIALDRNRSIGHGRHSSDHHHRRDGNELHDHRCRWHPDRDGHTTGHDDSRHDRLQEAQGLSDPHRVQRPVNIAEAQNLGAYSLTVAGKKNSFVAKNAKKIVLESAAYNAATNTVTLTARKAFALTKTVQLRVSGQLPMGLEDSIDRLIDGDHDGQPGGDAEALLGRSGIAISAVLPAE